MSRAVHEYGGIVQAYMGDGICAYFGVPAAREDDPERAARAALRILEVVSDYARDVEQAWGIEQFAVRVGINAGPAAVGLVGAVDEQTVAFGDTTNVAARLQSLAAPGTVVVGEEAARRLAHRFALDPLGKLSVRGRTGQVEVLRLVGPLRPEDETRSAPPRRAGGRGGAAPHGGRRARGGARSGVAGGGRRRHRQDPPARRARRSSRTRSRGWRATASRTEAYPPGPSRRCCVAGSGSPTRSPTSRRAPRRVHG